MARIPNAADYGLRLIESEFRPEKRSGGIRNALLANMANNPRIQMIREDFTGDTLNTALWAVDGDTGTTALAIPAAGSVIAGNGITGTTAADNNEAISIYGAAQWAGDLNCGMLFTAKFDVVTNFFWEAGFTDPLTDYTLPAFNDPDTPSITNGAVTVAVLAQDTSQTLTTAQLLCDGDATYTTSKTPPTSAWGPTAGAYFTAIIQCIGDTVVAAVFDSNLSRVFKVSKVSGFEGGTLVQPWFIVGNRTTSAIVPVIRRIHVWQDKN